MSGLYATRDIFFGKYFESTLRFTMPIDDGKTDTGMEIELCEAVLARNPHDINVLKLAGHLYTDAGEYTRGLAVDLALSQLCPDENLVWYNLACSYALLEQNDEAIDALGQAVNLGYDDLNHMQADADLDNIKEEPAYKQIIRKILKKK